MIHNENIKLGEGVGSLIFGIKENEAVNILGIPANKEEYSYPDESKRLIISYDSPKISLSFDSEDEYKLVAIDVEDNKINIEGLSLIGKDLEWAIRNLESKGFESPIIESISTQECPNSMILFYEKSGISLNFIDYICVSYSIAPLWINEEEIKWPKG
ncbi:MAG TPA: hypothetical protein ENJ95_21225 [Bacteroidetes bacterium]|nr:hypothetical protein [Bacteroidota bacterium]